MGYRAYAHRQGAVLAGSGLGKNPIRNLPLHHQQDLTWTRAPKYVEENGRSEIVGNVSHNLEFFWTGDYVGDTGREDVLVKNVDAGVSLEPYSEIRSQIIVKLHQDEAPFYFAHPSGQTLR